MLAECTEKKIDVSNNNKIKTSIKIVLFVFNVIYKSRKICGLSLTYMFYILLQKWVDDR